MFGIGQFLKRIQNSRTKDVLIVLSVKEAVKKCVGIEIPEKDIVIKSNKASLNNISQSLRSAIYIKKQAILKEINERQGFRVIDDVR